ncbi:basic helix-loop-helix ARNT-like protein 2 isoform X2 [Sardina pilchardus]
MTWTTTRSVWSEPVASSSSSSSFSCTDFPRKRKGKGKSLGSTMSGSSLHQVPLSSRMSIDAETFSDPESRSEGEDQQIKMKCFSREPHSQIEKRRRDKMNNLIDELSTMVPACNPLARKLDKLTVLRMAVQHLKSLKGASSSFSEAHPKPSFLPEDELKQLLLRAADGFLFVVSCTRGKIVFVSESISNILHYNRMELIGQSLFDYLHPKDVSKVKEQLSASELYPRERLIDTKTGVQVPSDVPSDANIGTGARRSFFCRMKQSRAAKSGKNTPHSSSSRKKESQRYCTVHCTGYMRSWSTQQMDTESEVDVDRESSHLTCLVAVGRIHPHAPPEEPSQVSVKPTEFVTRYAIDGKFTFVDQRATTIIGYLPQELLGTSCYEYFHQEDLAHLAESHKKVLHSKEKIMTNCYKFKTKQGSFVTLQSQWFSFINPWTKELEFIVSTNKVVSGNSEKGVEREELQDSRTLEASTEAKHLSPAIPGISSVSGTMIYAGSIGTQIANELLDFNRMNSPSSGTPSPFCLLPEKSPLAPSQPGSVPNREDDGEQPGKSQAGPSQGPSAVSFPGGEASTITDESSQLDLGSVGEPSGLGLGLSSDEAAMAVIMSILETDTNLSETVDFDELHWNM